MKYKSLKYPQTYDETVAPLETKGEAGLIVYDEEKREFVQVTKQDIKTWVKEAVKESMPPTD